MSLNDPLIGRDEVFPFRFSIDSDHKIHDVGRSLARMHEGIVSGVDIRDLFELTRPRIDLKFDLLKERAGTLVFLQLLDRDVYLRGQFLSVEDGLTFLGSPWFESLEQLAVNNLRIQDLAPHDATLENIFIRVAQTTQMRDLESVLEELRTSADEQERLTRAEESLAHDLNSAGDLIVRMTQWGEIVDIRAANPEKLPFDIERTVGTSISDLIPECATAWQSIVYELTHGASVAPFNFTVGETSNFESRIAFTLNNNLLMLARDVTEQQQLQIQLKHQAEHDPLTDLPNRLLFERRVSEALSENDDLAILFIDLDDFKSINDHRGHQAGDQLLKQVARDLQQTLRDTDTAARLGGDEFGVLLPAIENAETASIVAQRVLAAMQDDSEVDANRFAVKASIGVATTATSQCVETLFRDADIAMYQAKASSDDKVVVFESKMYTRLSERMVIRDELSIGLGRSEIVNHYQPIVRLSDTNIYAMEALARWDHPTRGLLSPFHFIEIAEESGLIVELGSQVLNQACRDAKHYCDNAGHDVSVNVNISAIQVQRDDFADVVRSALVRNELRPDLLTLEITESVLFADFEHASSVFGELKDIGVRVALDDFGAGHSSLKYLKQFPVDILKLDRSFVSDPGPTTLPLINAVIDMGRALDLKIVAEGIETQSQHNILSSFGCNWGQGYWYSRPVPLADLLERYGELDLSTEDRRETIRSPVSKVRPVSV